VVLAQNISALKQQFTDDMQAADTVSLLEAVKVKYLGKKGSVTALMQTLREVSAAERPAAGQQINVLKEELQQQLQVKQSTLARVEEEKQLADEKLDTTLPGRRRHLGRRHLITQVCDEVLTILTGMGFSIQYGPDIDTDYYNFEALNMDADHPARAMQDTFYITPQVLLRTHTSNIQVRMMESNPPPLRLIALGKAFRNEDVSARSHVSFHQIEALYVDRNVTFSDLLATLEIFLQKLFGPSSTIRVRPSYFPFVEPGMEVDIGCLVCQGTGCTLCKQSGWLEVGGAGMVHPEVLRSGGIDPEIYTGFAWGMGIDRIAMLKHGIRDIRLFSENDLRFLSQF
jgi:phenylalanyl-tRNA synthetase alpha chain